ncbi:cell division protein FtsQ/DivIB [Candidatus Pelagibacter sp. HIMB123]|uniref:cell division protein FtsQ/DivIB n=1 Tax=Candidatus Pelagibacter sp. HIMB123 TaxID=3415413 RepID=UPI003F825A51
MHQRKGKKIFIYFFLLFFLGSIQNTNLNIKNFKNNYFVKVSGLDEIENQILTKEIKNLNLENIFFMKKRGIYEIINNNSLVESFKIFKIYPYTLDIKIEKTIYLAKISIEKKIFIIGSNGKLLKNQLYNNELPFIFGNPKIHEFLEIKKIIDNSKFSFDEIKNLYFFPSKRWDLELKNNIFLKLPRDHIGDTLDHIFKIMNEKNFENITSIDARIINQLILK